MTARWRFTVWTRDGGPHRHFPTFAGAERYARGYVADTLRETGGCIPVGINRDGIAVAWVRADGLERVWTDFAANAAGVMA